MNKPQQMPQVSRPVPRKRPRSTRFAALVRWLHIYISLLGFTALLFFAVTGITLNHPSWFGGDEQKLVEAQGSVDPAWLNLASPSEAVGESASEVSDQVARLEIVEFLRAEHQLRGAVREFRVDDYECMVIFKGPGYAADVFIDRESGKYTLTETLMGAVAIINDLHKGRDSGTAWSWVIDLTAILMVLVSLTGLVLIFYIKRRRRSGVVTAVVGTILVAAVYLLWVP